MKLQHSDWKTTAYWKNIEDYNNSDANSDAGTPMLRFRNGCELLTTNIFQVSQIFNFASNFLPTSLFVIFS